MLLVNQFAEFIIEPYLKSNRVSQRDERKILKKVKIDLKICSWAETKMLLANQIAQFKQQLDLKKLYLRSISYIFCMLIENQIDRCEDRVINILGQSGF